MLYLRVYAVSLKSCANPDNLASMKRVLRFIPYIIASAIGFAYGFKFGYEISGIGLAILTGFITALICNFMTEYVIHKLSDSK